MVACLSRLIVRSVFSRPGSRVCHVILGVLIQNFNSRVSFEIEYTPFNTFQWISETYEACTFSNVSLNGFQLNYCCIQLKTSIEFLELKGVRSFLVDRTHVCALKYSNYSSSTSGRCLPRIHNKTEDMTLTHNGELCLCKMMYHALQSWSQKIIKKLFRHEYIFMTI